MSAKLERCHWCGKKNRTPSAWEQKNLSGEWHRLCVRCANVRLDNPWNALLGMREAVDHPAEERKP
jgi:hypothetical protein